MQPDFSNLIELLSDVVQKHPDRIAIRDYRESYTYSEMYNCSAAVSARLLHYCIQPGERIVCISKKDTRSLICFWGILLCGAIPVMLDEEDNVHANEIKIKEVQPSVIILDKSKSLPVTEKSIVLLDFDEVLATRPVSFSEKLHKVTYPEVCYILLTSGTTGNPKAVQISHTNVLHYTFSIYKKIGSPENVNAVHASTFAADLGLTNLLVALVSGGMLRILNKTESTDPALFRTIIEEEKISLLKITPSHLLSLVAYSKQVFKVPVENIILGGEKLSWETVSTIFSLHICNNLYNHYGPTEATIGAIAYKIEPSSPHFNKAGSIPLGTPLGQGACFLDNPDNCIGELYITGPGVSIGYFENDVENKKKFSIRSINGKDVLCYRTGDICKQLDDGNFEFLYRTDRQVKIKGYRIELGEIEMAIAAHPEVENVYVVASDNGQHQFLEAFIKPRTVSQLTPAALRTWLSGKLSGYKVPANIYFYSKAPFNANGKIDLEALKKTFKSEDGLTLPEVDAATNESWAAQATYNWMKVLNRNVVSEADHFFETGGDSLLAIQLIGRLQRGGYKVHISDLNNNPRLKDFIELQPARRMSEEESPADKIFANKFTFSQYRFLQQQEFNLNHYCQTILMETENSIKVREMALAVNNVLQNHWQLSMAFKKNWGTCFSEKVYLPGINLGTTVLNNRYPSVLKIQETCTHLLNEISLENGKLFAAHIFVDPDRKDYLFLACHHLCIDVISWNIIIEELLDNYEQILKNALPVTTIENSMARFFQALSQIKMSPSLSDRLAVHPVSRLPLQEPVKDSIELTSVYNLVIPEDMCEALLKVEGRAATMLQACLMSAFARGVLKEFGIDQITLDLEFHGRPHHEQLPDISRSVAWWATTLPITLEHSRLGVSYCNRLIEEKKAWANSLNLYHNEFGAVSTERPDIRFNYLGHFPEHFGNGAIQMKPSVLNAGPTRSKNAQREYKLYFTGRFIGPSLIIDIQYQPAYITKRNIEGLIKSFFSSLKNYLKKEKQQVQSTSLLKMESNIPSVGQPLYNVNIKSDTKPTNKRNIFLTGATGFLGAHLLRECLKNDQVTVYCLVRGENQLHAENRLSNCYQYYFKEGLRVNSNRIKILKGDLLQQNFGLARSVYRKLEDEIDTIVHSAADVNLTKDYSKLVHTNLTSTQNIIALAQSKKSKSIHYISTLAVSGYPADGESRNFSENDFEYGQLFTSDYERSKFEAEKMIRAFFKNTGNGKIYRVGHIAASSVNGRFQRNIGQNRILQIIKGMLLTGQIPNNYNEKLSFSYVDIVAKGIAGIFLENIYSEMHCLHMESPHYISFIRIAEMLQQLGYEIEVVNMETFKNTVEHFVAPVAEKNEVGLMSNWIQRAIDFPRKINYISSNSLQLLAQTGLYFPQPGLEWFSALIKEAINAGYFHSPRLKSTFSSLLSAELI